MNISEFYPELRQIAPNAPSSLFQRLFVNAARSFCQRTRVLRLAKGELEATVAETYGNSLYGLIERDFTDRYELFTGKEDPAWELGSGHAFNYIYEGLRQTSDNDASITFSAEDFIIPGREYTVTVDYYVGNGEEPSGDINMLIGDQTLSANWAVGSQIGTITQWASGPLVFPNVVAGAGTDEKRVGIQFDSEYSADGGQSTRTFVLRSIRVDGPDVKSREVVVDITGSDYDLVDLKMLRFDGKDLEVMPLAMAQELVSPNNYENKTGAPAYQYLKDETSIGLYPQPAVADVALLEHLIVIVKPRLDASTLPDTLMDMHENAILAGVYSALYLMPNKEWSSKSLAASYKQEFEEAVDVASQSIQDGNMKGIKRTVGYGGI